MYSYKSDYGEGAHERILLALSASNMEQEEGYGEDRFTLQAIELIKTKIGREDVDIHLFSGGTQTNLTAISAFLRPHEAVIAAKTGHILVHETGAIEATGHKIISVDTRDGKLDAGQIKAVLEEHSDEHMVRPKLVYISNSTEVGSIYKLAELKALYQVCQENGLFLYMDGARLGSALCSEENDMVFSDLSRLVDAFYIGGTKNGALLGEALVICREELKEDFRYLIKQRGALMAKGRILGLQFVELFKDDLYFDLATHANNMADLLRREIAAAGYGFYIESNTNQLFPILPNGLIEELQNNFDFYIWNELDGGSSVIRLVTSWATKESAVWEFVEELKWQTSF